MIGQANFTDNAPNRGGAPSASTLSSPWAVDVNRDGQMAVADSANNRVLVWDALPAGDPAPADHVIGQADFVHNTENDDDQDGQADGTPDSRTLNRPAGVRFHDRKLVVVDFFNFRVLVFPASDPPARNRATP